MEKRRSAKGKTAELEKMTPGELRRTVRLVTCLGIFAAAAIVKAVFPGAVENIREDALEVIGGNVNYQAAMASLGETVAGEKPFREAMAEVYEYAFSTDGEDDTVEADAELEAPEPEGVEAEEYTEPEPVIKAETLAYIHDGETPPPENASYEPAELNFDYAVPTIGTVTSHFGYRNHPVDKVVRFHYGTDIGASEGSDVCAFADGTVYAVGESSSLGKYVMIDHRDSVRTIYGHLSGIAARDGDEVKLGQKIGEVGSTGNATGSCLHFEVQVNKINVDPEYYIS